MRRLGVLVLVHPGAVLAASSGRLLFVWLIMAFADFWDLYLQALELRLPGVARRARGVVESYGLDLLRFYLLQPIAGLIGPPALVRPVQQPDLIGLERNILN